jgi:AcrR family transcriptional regulator
MSPLMQTQFIMHSSPRKAVQRPITRERLNARKRKDQIVQVVLKLVAERGADAVSTQQIADLIGFTQPAVFRHFPTKEDIWSAVLDWLDDQLEAVRASARATAPDQGLGVIQRIFFGHIGLIERHPGLAKVVMSDHIRQQFPNLNGRFAALYHQYEMEIRKALGAAVETAQISHRIDQRAATTLFFCAIQGLGFQFSIARLRPSIRKDASRVFRLFVRALKVDD